MLAFAPRAAAQPANEAPIEIANADLATLQQAVDDGILTYTGIMTLYLDRIEAYADVYDCLITVNPDALALAAAADEAYARSGRTSLLFGLPVMVKDNIDVVGMPTTGGSAALDDSYPKANAPVAQSLIDAGAIIIAKTNMDLFALNAYLSSSDYGLVKNAYNADYSAYGSSGGSAVAVSLSLCAAALGTDTNSSARLPAAANGVYTLRPTYGILSGDGVLPYDFDRDTTAPMARSVSDLAALYGALTGTDYTATLTAASLADMKIGIVPQISGMDEESYCDPDVAACFTALLDALEAAGAQLVTLDALYDSSYSYIPSNTMTGWTFQAYFDDYIQGTDGSIRSFAQLASRVYVLEEYVNDYTVADVLADSKFSSQNERKAIYADYLLSCMDESGVDFVLFPSMRNNVQPHSSAAGLYNNTSLFAPASGFPELSMPAGLDSNGLPIGIELLGRPNAEALLLDAAQALNALTGTVARPDDAADLYTVPDEVATLIALYSAGITPPYTGFQDGYDAVSGAYDDIGDWFAEYGSFTGDRAVYATALFDALTAARADYEAAYAEHKTSTGLVTGVLPWIIALVVGTTVAVVVLSNAARRRKRRQHRRKKHNT